MISLASVILMSCWPKWTPSAFTSPATLTRSLMINRVPLLAVISRISPASDINSSSDIVFSRNCMASAPPSMTSLAVSLTDLAAILPLIKT